MQKKKNSICPKVLHMTLKYMKHVFLLNMGKKLVNTALEFTPITSVPYPQKDHRARDKASATPMRLSTAFDS